jgi:hypothetical protein
MYGLEGTASKGGQGFHEVKCPESVPECPDFDWQATATGHVRRRKMASSLRRFEPIQAAPPSVCDGELTRMVSDLTRDVEQFDSLLHSQRQLLEQRAGNGAMAGRQLREIRARVGILTTKVHSILDELALPVADS